VNKSKNLKKQKRYIKQGWMIYLIMEYFDIKDRSREGTDIWIMKGSLLNNLKRYEEAIKCFIKTKE